MRAERIAALGFRNLQDLDLDLPPGGAVFLGPNAHGKTSLLEALYYPVLCRSFRAAPDADLGRWGGTGFHLTLEASVDGVRREFAAGFVTDGRRKRVAVDGEELARVTDAIGRWLAVAFLPDDLVLVTGPAAERRRYLDRVLSLADPGYLAALVRFRGVVARRNAALREGRPEVARAFAAGMAEPGAVVVRARRDWVARLADRFAEECAALGEAGPVTLRYRGTDALADEAAWPEALRAAEPRELARGMSLVGPQRDDLVLEHGGRPLRAFGSTGQQRTAAVALKLCELATLTAGRGVEPVLLLDDVFAELDRERQDRLAARLGDPGVRQVFVTAPRRDELPPALELEVFEVRDGGVRQQVAR